MAFYIHGLSVSKLGSRSEGRACCVFYDMCLKWKRDLVLIALDSEYNTSCLSRSLNRESVKCLTSFGKQHLSFDYFSTLRSRQAGRIAPPVWMTGGRRAPRPEPRALPPKTPPTPSPENLAPHTTPRERQTTTRSPPCLSHPQAPSNFPPQQQPKPV